MSVVQILNLIFFTYYLANSAPQTVTEINDRIEETTRADIETNSNTIRQVDTEPVTVTNRKTDNTEYNNETDIPDQAQINDTALQVAIRSTTTIEQSEGFMTKLYKAIETPLTKFIENPKANEVLKNVGTCTVNGVMELISYFFPAPLIPLIASVAGMMIPFEPVVTLRKRMPVTNYRRAFNSAVNSFMGTFDTYKRSEEDPYMTRRFNRRFLDKSEEKDLN